MGAVCLAAVWVEWSWEPQRECKYADLGHVLTIVLLWKA